MKDINQKRSPAILFLNKTRNSESIVLREIGKLKFENSCLFSPITPGGGGLALCWNQEVQIVIVDKTISFIDTRATYKGTSFFATFIYGDPDKSKRKEVWNRLSKLAEARDEAWFITGDFNDILNEEEKTGGLARTEGSYSDFRTFTLGNDMFDLKHSGNMLSWRGKRNQHLVVCRLDRAMANSYWAEKFLTGRSEYLEFEGSDHRPTLSLFSPTSKKQRRLFRYDRILRKNKEVTRIIKTAWKMKSPGSMLQKLEGCRKAIESWNKEKHLNSKKEIYRLKRELDKEMSKLQPSESLLANVNSALREAYLAEEDYWKQRSCTSWLALGNSASSTQSQEGDER